MAGLLLFVTHIWVHLPVDSFTSIFLTVLWWRWLEIFFSKKHERDPRTNNKGFFTYRELRGGGRSLLVKADDAALV